MCGYLTASLISTGRMSHSVVAAPIFSGHAGAVYHSVIVTRADGPSSLRGALDTRLAVNEVESWSGFHGLKATSRVLPRPLVHRSNGHRFTSGLDPGRGQTEV